MTRALKDLALLVGGTLLGLLTSLLLEVPIRLCLTVAVGLGGTALALYGLSVADMAYYGIIRVRRGARARHKRIVGILSDSDQSTPWSSKSTWTAITPYQWKYAMQNKSGLDKRLMPTLSPRMTALSKRIEKYNIILNPYGGSYPEEDTIKFQNLDCIF